jgi:hypothetical protein
VENALQPASVEVSDEGQSVVTSGSDINAGTSESFGHRANEYEYICTEPGFNFGLLRPQMLLAVYSLGIVGQAHSFVLFTYETPNTEGVLQRRFWTAELLFDERPDGSRQTFVRMAGPEARFNERLQQGYSRNRNSPAVILENVSVDQIHIFALVIMAQFPPYTWYANNCHTFAKELYSALKVQFRGRPVAASLIEDVEAQARILLSGNQQSLPSLIPASTSRKPLGQDVEQELMTPRLTERLLSFWEGADAKDEKRFYLKRLGITLVCQRGPPAVHFFYDTWVMAPGATEATKIRKFFTLRVLSVDGRPHIVFEEAVNVQLGTFQEACQLRGISVSDIRTIAVVMLSRYETSAIWLKESQNYQILHTIYEAINRLFGERNFERDELAQLAVDFHANKPEDPSLPYLPSIVPGAAASSSSTTH